MDTRAYWIGMECQEVCVCVFGCVYVYVYNIIYNIYVLCVHCIALAIQLAIRSCQYIYFEFEFEFDTDHLRQRMSRVADGESGRDRQYNIMENTTHIYYILYYI